MSSFRTREDDHGILITALQARLNAELPAILERLDALEAHAMEARPDIDQHTERIGALEPKVAQLETSYKRVERQLDLVFAQGKSNARSLGEQTLLLQRLEALLEQLVRHYTPSVVVDDKG